MLPLLLAGCESVMSERPSAGRLKKGSIARAQEEINSKGNILDMYYLLTARVEKSNK